MTIASIITLIRIAFIPIYIFFMHMSGGNTNVWMWCAFGLFIFASLTDWVDGYVARKYHQVTDFGKFLDPLADKLLVLASMVMFCGWGTMPAWALMLMLTREFMVTSVRLLAAKDGVVVAASFAGKLKTVMQMVSIIYMIAAFQVCDLYSGNWALGIVLISIGIALIWIATIASVVSGIQYVWALRHYFKES